MDVTLYQFRYSPYNEKIRWALDYKGIAHRRSSLLPGPHAMTTMRISKQSATPVLRDGTNIVAGSAAILDYLDEAYPERALTPKEPGLAREARAIETAFDEGFTPRMRRALLSRLLQYPDYMVKIFGGDHALIQRILYRLTLPLAAGLVRKGNGISGEASIADGEAAIREALDFIAEKSRATGFLVGEKLSRADVTAASAIGAVTAPPGTPMERPSGAPKPFADWSAGFAGHEGAKWAARLLKMPRRPSP